MPADLSVTPPGRAQLALRALVEADSDARTRRARRRLRELASHQQRRRSAPISRDPAATAWRARMVTRWLLGQSPRARARSTGG